MSGRYLLDTNIVIALLGREQPVLDRLVSAERVFIPSIVLGELYFGARKSARASENLSRVDEFAANRWILGCGAEAARNYGKIKVSLRQRGRPIPENDIWVAAIAQTHNLVLATRDNHFDEIEDLQLEVW